MEGFEKQFENSEVKNIPSGEVEIFEIKPYREKTVIPVLFVPGWGQSKNSFKETLKLLSNFDRRVLAVAHTTGWGKGHILENYNYHTEEALKSRAVLNLIQEKKLEKVDLIGHGEGVIDALFSTSLKPTLFRHLILAGISGLIGKKIFPQTTSNIFTENFSKNSAGREISVKELKNMITDVSKKGVRVSLVHGENDQVVSVKTASYLVSRADTCLVEADHDQIYTTPENYTGFIEAVLLKSEENKDRAV